MNERPSIDCCINEGLNQESNESTTAVLRQEGARGKGEALGFAAPPLGNPLAPKWQKVLSRTLQKYILKGRSNLLCLLVQKMNPT